MPAPDYIPPGPAEPLPDWLKEIFTPPQKDPIAPFRMPMPEREKEPA